MPEPSSAATQLAVAQSGWVDGTQVSAEDGPSSAGLIFAAADGQSCLSLPVIPALHTQNKAGTVDVGRDKRFSGGLKGFGVSVA